MKLLKRLEIFRRPTLLQNMPYNQKLKFHIFNINVKDTMKLLMDSMIILNFIQMIFHLHMLISLEV